MRKIFAVAAVTGLLVGHGCGKPFNEQIDLVGTEPLPALSVDADGEPLSGSPSLQGFDRRHWPLVTVQVPTSQTAHYRTYAPNLHLRSSDGGPWDQRFPTAAAALDDGAGCGADLASGLVEPLWAFGVLAWAPIDMVILQRWPWHGVRSPAEPYDRVPPGGETDLGPWVDVGQTDVRWTDEGAGAVEPR